MNNPLETGKQSRKEKSPLDPHECCVWANERMASGTAVLGYRWVVTGNKDKPIELQRYRADGTRYLIDV